ncbi:MAG: hypothetical protein FJ215_01395 [Ignavibacteria bacterium]|nr:hypothetical protein [Ignavibacteria bacterium]
MRKNIIPILFVVLLGANGVILYEVWQGRSRDTEQMLKGEVLQLSEKEFLLHWTNNKINDQRFERRRLTINAYVLETHCDVCLQDARPYWNALAEDSIATLRIYYKSQNPRQWERFASWMNLRKENIVSVPSNVDGDAMMWVSSGPTVIVSESTTGRIVLVNVSTPPLRERSILFYEYLMKYLKNEVDAKTAGRQP